MKNSNAGGNLSGMPTYPMGLIPLGDEIEDQASQDLQEALKKRREKLTMTRLGTDVNLDTNP